MPDLVILAKWLAAVNAGFVNARFLIFSTRCNLPPVQLQQFGNAGFGNFGKVTCRCECWVVNAGFLVFSPRYFAASVIAKCDTAGFGNSSKVNLPQWIWYFQQDVLPPVQLLEFGIARFGNSGKVTCRCVCWVYECQIFDIFVKVLCCQCKCGNLAMPHLGIQAKWLAAVNAGFVNAGLWYFQQDVLPPGQLWEFGITRFGIIAISCYK